MDNSVCVQYLTLLKYTPKNCTMSYAQSPLKGHSNIDLTSGCGSQDPICKFSEA